MVVDPCIQLGLRGAGDVGERLVPAQSSSAYLEDNNRVYVPFRCLRLYVLRLEFLVADTNHRVRLHIARRHVLGFDDRDTECPRLCDRAIGRRLAVVRGERRTRRHEPVRPDLLRGLARRDLLERLVIVGVRAAATSSEDASSHASDAVDDTLARADREVSDLCERTTCGRERGGVLPCFDDDLGTEHKVDPDEALLAVLVVDQFDVVFGTLEWL